MIGDSKIQHAANQYVGHGPEVDEGIYVSAKREAFVEGVKWLQSALWHDASEKPQGSAAILYLWHDEQGGMDVGIDGIFDDLEWKKFVEYNKITKWCYINDILLKGGDK